MSFYYYIFSQYFCRYDSNLGTAKANGIKQGMFVGVTLGLIFFLQFCLFALAFWYGAKMVREQPNAYDGGTITAVSVAITTISVTITIVNVTITTLRVT